MAQLIKTIYQSYGKIITYSSLGSILVATIFPFILLPFLANVLPANEFGQITVLLSLVNFTQNVLTSNIGQNVYRRHKSFSPKEKRAFFGKLFWLNNFISFSALIIFIIIYPYLSQRISLNYELWQSAPFFIYMGFSGASAMMVVFLSSDLDFKRLFQAQSLLFLGSFSVFGFYFIFGANYWSLGIIVGPVIFFLTLLTFIYKKEVADLCSFPNFAFIKSIFYDTFIWTLSAFGLSFLIYGDRWLMVELGFPFSEIGIYTVAIQANMLIIFAITQISLVAIPLISNIEKLENISISQLRKMFVILSFMIIGVFIVGGLLGPIYIKLFYGLELWEKSEKIFFILLIGTCFYPIQIFSRGFLIKFYPLTLTLFLNFLSGFSLVILTYILNEISIPNLAMASAKAITYGILGISSFVFVFLPIVKTAKQSKYYDGDEC